MGWKLCQLVMPALYAADICASNAETLPGITPGEDSTVLEASFHRTIPTALWRRLLSGEVTYLKTPWGAPHRAQQHQPWTSPSTTHHNACLSQRTINATPSALSPSASAAFSLLYSMLSDAILIPSEIVIHRLQTHWGARRHKGYWREGIPFLKGEQLWWWVTTCCRAFTWTDVSGFRSHLLLAFPHINQNMFFVKTCNWGKP